MNYRHDLDRDLSDPSATSGRLTEAVGSRVAVLRWAGRRGRSSPPSVDLAHALDTAFDHAIHTGQIYREWKRR